MSTHIWPNIQTSNQANNTSIKTLWISSNSDWNEDSWNGITTALYSSDYNQERSKYLDIWLNDTFINDTFFTLNIDIGYISEDINNNGKLDSEDRLSILNDVGVGVYGNNLLDEGEDPINTGKIISIYPSTSELKNVGIDSRGFRRIISSAMESVKNLIPDFYGENIRKKHELINLSEAIKNIATKVQSTSHYLILGLTRITRYLINF